jgi:hypothetical protein
MGLSDKELPSLRPAVHPMLYSMVLLIVLGLYVAAYRSTVSSVGSVVGGAGEYLHVRYTACDAFPNRQNTTFSSKSMIGRIFAPAHYFDAHYFRHRMWDFEVVQFPNNFSINGDFSDGRTLSSPSGAPPDSGARNVLNGQGSETITSTKAD